MLERFHCLLNYFRFKHLVKYWVTLWSNFSLHKFFQPYWWAFGSCIATSMWNTGVKCGFDQKIMGFYMISLMIALEGDQRTPPFFYSKLLQFTLFWQLHTILDEIIFGGQVLETSSIEVIKAVEEISKCSLSLPLPVCLSSGLVLAHFCYVITNRWFCMLQVGISLKRYRTCLQVCFWLAKSVACSNAAVKKNQCHNWNFEMQLHSVSKLICVWEGELLWFRLSCQYDTVFLILKILLHWPLKIGFNTIRRYAWWLLAKAGLLEVVLKIDFVEENDNVKTPKY